MTNTLNLSIIEGRLVRAPELRTTTSGTQLTTLSIAVNEYSKSRGTSQTYTTFLSCTVWGKLAEHCVKYLIKGQSVRIKGKLHQSSWIDGNGEKHSKLEIKAMNVEFLAKPKKAETVRTAEMQNHTESVPF
ncbi:MAG: single-stranded DNA-binding protein [Spirochaetales bacterium]|nr:single-stranded DNA-binding protein [Spirochaetales bacterium]